MSERSCGKVEARESEREGESTESVILFYFCYQKKGQETVPDSTYEKVRILSVKVFGGQLREDAAYYNVQASTTHSSWLICKRFFKKKK